MTLIDDLCLAYDEATPDRDACSERGMAAALRALAEHILDSQFRSSARTVAELLLREAQEHDAAALPSADELLAWRPELDQSLSAAERNPSLVRR